MWHHISDRKRSNFAELLALAFLIHFFGALFYGIFITILFNNSIASNNYDFLLSGSALHLLLGCLSISSIITTMILEWLYIKPMSMTIAKYLYQLWKVGICALILWAVINSIFF